MFFAILLFAASAVLCFLLAIFNKENDETIPCAVMGALIMVFIVGGIYILDEEIHPSITPMDVYRGKTTLEITYKDSVAIDSVVVWKD